MGLKAQREKKNKHAYTMAHQSPHLVRSQNSIHFLLLNKGMY